MANLKQKIIFGIIIAAILIMVGVSVFNQYVPTRVSQVVQETPASAVQQPTLESTKSHFKLTKYLADGKTNTITGVVKNINNDVASATIRARLYFKTIVAEQTITVEDIKIYEERSFEIKFDNPPTWNAFTVELV